MELFMEFYELQNNQPMSQVYRKSLQEIYHPEQKECSLKTGYVGPLSLYGGKIVDFSVGGKKGLSDHR